MSNALLRLGRGSLSERVRRLERLVKSLNPLPGTGTLTNVTTRGTTRSAAGTKTVARGGSDNGVYVS